MLDVIVALQKVLNVSAKESISKWFSLLPKGAAWHLISDYVLGDPDRHDTASFVILLHHDKLETILGYIENQAPADIKRSRSASRGLIKYLQSPVVFSFTFVLDDGDRFLATYANVTEMISGLEDLHGVACSMGQKSDPDDPYFPSVQKRLRNFIDDLRRKGNAKLARQVFLTSAYAAVVMDYLDQATDPNRISWASDRDAMLLRHDGVVWDIAALYFYMLKAERIARATARTVSHFDTPRLVHIAPEETGPNYLDPLIRMPDYLAAAASGLNFHTQTFDSEKLDAIGRAVFFESENSVLCTLSWTGDGFLIRRLRAVSD